MFINIQSAFAVSVSIINYPPTISQDTFTVTASISGAATGTNYLRVDIYKDGTSNYFGETFNTTDWYSGSDGKQYFPVSVVSGAFWNGTIQARIGSVNTTDYDGVGNYKLRLRRYTSSGGLGSEDANVSSVSILIALPTITPTPSPTDKPAPTNTPNPTSKPTATTIPPTIKPQATPTKMPTISLFPSPKSSPSGDILGASISATVEPTVPKESTKVKSQSFQVLPFIFIAFGIMLLISGGIWIIRLRSNQQSEKEE